MKHIKIIFTLTIVVLIASVMVFYVEGFTTPIIDDYNIEQANKAKFEVLPSLTTSDELEFDLTYDFSDSTISGIIVNAGVGYIYTAQFQGYSSIVEYMIGIDDSGNLSGFKVLTQGESPGYGDTITEENYRLQFVGLSFEDAIDGNIDDVAGLSGAPVTMGAFRESLKAVIQFHQSNFTDVVIETPEERADRVKLETFPLAVRYEDVTALYEVNEDISFIYEAYDAGDLLLGYIYYVDAEGAGYTSPSIISFLVGFNLDKEITGFALLTDTETAGKTGDMYEDEYGTAFVGDDMETDDYGVDDIGGSTDTNVRIHEVVKEISEYHVEFILQEGVFVRPVNIDVTNENLLLAFPEGITFTSVYENYSYNEVIGNVYEVYNVGDVLLGYVYYSEFTGYSNIGTVKFVLGIDVSGTTNLIEILDSSETWNDAEEYSSYNGLSGYFPDVVWLDYFEGVSLLELIIDPVDVIAGVSTTTGSMLSAIQDTLQYHLFEVTGGVN